MSKFKHALLLLCSLVLFTSLSVAQNQSTTKDLQLQIAPATLSITTASLPAGKVGTAYNVQLTATGGVAPYVWTVCTVAPCQTNALPAGLTLSSGGLLSGTPTVAAKVTITFQVTDNSGSVAQINIQFVPSVSQGVTAYNLKRGIVANGETQLVQLLPTQNTYVDQVPKVSGTSYFYVATALAGALESANSNEAMVTLP